MVRRRPDGIALYPLDRDIITELIAIRPVRKTGAALAKEFQVKEDSVNASLCRIRKLFPDKLKRNAHGFTFSDKE